jgi:hypothetical protein
MMKPPDQATRSRENTSMVVTTDLNFRYRTMKMMNSDSGSTTISVFCARTCFRSCPRSVKLTPGGMTNSPLRIFSFR